MRSDSKNSIPFCPLQQCGRQVVRSGRNFQHDIRKLRQMQEHCELCSLELECATRMEFEELVQLVVNDINREWGWS
jgi:hypothetical protein